MDWVISFTSCAMLWMMGNKSKWGPILGLVNQVLWVIYCVHIHQYGLLLGVVAYTVVHIRNAWLWRKGDGGVL